MDFELDKHDLFRNVVPGFISLLVVFSYVFVNNGFSFPNDSTVKAFELLLVIAITLPIGYIIHNIYRAWHVASGELAVWEGYESGLIEKLATDKNLTEQLKIFKTDETKKVKEFSWLIETCLHVESSGPIRERGYHLISRVHSLGSSIVAVLFAFLVLAYFTIFQDFQSESLISKNVILSCIWSIIVVCFCQARVTAIEGYQALIKHFVTIRQNLIAETIAGKIDPFEKTENKKS